MPTRPRTAPDGDLIRARVLSLPRRFRREAADGLVAGWELRLGDQTFGIAVAAHRCTVQEGPSPAADTVIVADPATWLALDEGTLTGGDAYFRRALDVKGNLDLAVRLQTLFRPYRRPRRPADLDEVDVAADGIRISAYVVGRGAPLLLLHGLGGSKITWLPLLSALARDHRVIVPDLPGHGESEKPVGDYTPRFHARVLRGVMDELGVERAMVVGSSLGGRIAVELALRSSGRVSALALLDPSVPGLRWRHVMALARVVPSELGSLPVPLRERWMRLAIRRLFARPHDVQGGAYALAAQEFIRIYRDPRARVAFLSSLRHIITEKPEPFFSSLRGIEQPALVIFGDRDRLVPARLGERLVQHLPQATLKVLPDVGHVPHFEATEQTLAHLRAFLDWAPPGSPSL